MFSILNTSLLSFSLCLLITQISYSQIIAFSSKAEEIEWVSLDQALAKAAIEKKNILLAFHSEGCPYCKKMKEQVYRDAEIIKKILKYFIPVELDLSKRTDFLYKGHVMSSTALAEIFNVKGTPTITFLNNEGDLIAFQPGYLNPKLFSKLIEYVGTGVYATMSFKEFIAE